VNLKPGEERTVHFLLTWFFPSYKNTQGPLAQIIKTGNLKRQYATRFTDAAAVAEYVAKNFDRLSSKTLLWNATWYDSTLPYWFLDRTFLTIDCLATQTVHWFDNGRFWAWEGVDCCAGTCQHVWNYAQGPARIFPQFERDMRERVDFGLSWHETGATDYRGENARKVAHDGHLGTILRAYREHLTSRDDLYLKRIWPRVKKSIEFAIGWDGDGDGLLEGEQFNTLDAAWYGRMGWISSMFVAVLRAGEAMALEMGDQAFANRCRTLAERGSQELVKQLFNGEYFIHKTDPAHPEATNTNDGCHIDQCMGQALALQVNLPRITPADETRKALASLWKYNFTPDAGVYHTRHLAMFTAFKKRWYALAGEAGTIMTSFPRGSMARATGKHFAHYLSEVWTGQEHQLAAHMIWEGAVENGLAVTRAVHDRHHAALRNPYNEVECSYHYSRAMASYGSFIAICGFEYHGPKGHIGFAPRLTPENFKAAFTAAEGWGSFSQNARRAEIAVKWGKLRVKTVALAGRKVAKALANGQPVEFREEAKDGRVLVTLDKDVTVTAGQTLEMIYE
jgi:non-lysosomal glucosylceramidase